MYYIKQIPSVQWHKQLLLYQHIEHLNTFSIFCCYNTTFCFCLQPTKKPFPHSTTDSSSVESHSTHYRSFQGRFYRPHDQTNSVKALKETSWSSRSGLNPSRTTPPCYNNITLGNHHYAERKGPYVTNPICWTCNNCSYKCAADCEHCHTVQKRAVLIIFPLNLQTITINQILSSGGEGVPPQVFTSK